jgi:hypothetical protein
VLDASPYSGCSRNPARLRNESQLPLLCESTGWVDLVTTVRSAGKIEALYSSEGITTEQLCGCLRTELRIDAQVVGPPPERHFERELLGSVTEYKLPRDYCSTLYDCGLFYVSAANLGAPRILKDVIRNA